LSSARRRDHMSFAGTSAQVWHIPDPRLKEHLCCGANLEYGKFAPFVVDAVVRIMI